MGVESKLTKPQSKDDALEALDFIVNVLKEHEKDLDKLINELATVTEQMGDTTELTEKVQTIEEKIGGLQKEVTTLVSCMSGASKALPVAVKESAQEPIPSTAVATSTDGPTVVLRCNQLEDFQVLAAKAQSVSFSYKDDEKVFQVDALKGNQVISYTGALPKLAVVLKVYLSKQLCVPEGNIVEGLLSVA